MNEIVAGTLYVVATPIGNRGDLSPRAQTVLGAVDCVAAEDTRVTGALLSSLGVRARMVSLHEHNEHARVSGLLDKLAGGESVALVSDAGTPLISDPGFALVRAAREAGHPVVTVPGPCAAIAALSVSGLPTDRFLFAGFISARAGARRQQFEALRSAAETLVFYVSKRQVAAALADAAAVFGEARPAALSRELTKLHETTLSGTLASLAADWAQAEQRGELVLMIGGSSATASDAQLEQILDVLLEFMSTRDAASAAARLADVPRRQAYAAALARASGGD